MSFTPIFAKVAGKANMELKVRILRMWDVTSRKKILQKLPI